MKFLKPDFIVEWMTLLKEEGLKAFMKKKGWKVLLIIVIFYTIRDGILYILVPYMIYKGFF